MDNIVHLGDCMDGMKDKPDNFYGLAIVDPPYGIGIVEAVKKSTIPGTKSMFKLTKGSGGHDFDASIPSPEYFTELLRVAKQQIIWGGNYFIHELSATPCFVIWDKMNGTNPMADAEMAWTSFDSRIRIFRMHHFSKGYGDKIHIAQKPVKLYKWLLTNYGKPGDTILDTHVGSGSSRIACHDMGFDFEGWEIDADYWQAQEERYIRHAQQVELFEFKGGKINE